MQLGGLRSLGGLRAPVEWADNREIICMVENDTHVQYAGERATISEWRDCFLKPLGMQFPYRDSSGAKGYDVSRVRPVRVDDAY